MTPPVPTLRAAGECRFPFYRLLQQLRLWLCSRYRTVSSRLLCWACCANDRTCTCKTAEEVPGTTGYVGNCPIGESYCAVAPYCRVVPGGTRDDAINDETTCETQNADAGTQANQWTDNAHVDESGCSAAGGTWTPCESHTPTMCFAQLPQHCAGAFTKFGPCLDADGVEHPCECPTGDCTHVKTYKISSTALDAAPRYASTLGGPNSDIPVPTQTEQGPPAAATSCPQLEPTCTADANTLGATDCEQTFAYASGTTMFNSAGGVLANTAPQDSDCPDDCVYTAIASSGVDADYNVETSCAEYSNNVPRANTFTAAYCEIAATDGTVCANGQYTYYDEDAAKCIRTIATTKASCEDFPHPEVSDCAAIEMIGAASAANAACIAVPGCVYVPNSVDAQVAGECTPVGGSTWVPNQCRDSSTGAEQCQEVVFTGGAQNAAANRLACQAQPGCVYTPDDAATTEDEEICLIRNEEACEYKLLSIQNGQQSVSGKGLFAYSGGGGAIDVGDTITVVQALGSDLVGETVQVASVYSADMATVTAPWQQETGGVAVPMKFSVGAGACPGERA